MLEIMEVITFESGFCDQTCEIKVLIGVPAKAPIIPKNKIPMIREIKMAFIYAPIKVQTKKMNNDALPFNNSMLSGMRQMKVKE